MNAIRKSAYLKVAALLAALGTASLYAVMDFSPSTQPANVVGAYSLRSTDLSKGGTIAYRPFFDNVFWQGDIIEYAIDSVGNRTTDAEVGTNPAASGTQGGCGRTAPSGCWSARAVFDASVASVTDYWKAVTGGRNIFTLQDTNNDGTGDTQADFLWDNLSDTQKTALDASTAANAALIGSYDSPVLNFIRGDRTEEKGSGNGGAYRDRNSLLGDIINSWPVYISAPEENYTIDGFIDFRNAHSGSYLRDGRIAVGANDGMLHVFDEDDGSEVYAYIPSMLLNKLDRLTVIPYDSSNHTYYVDGKILVASAQVNSTWKTVLTSGLGAGATGLFALDVTSADMSSNKVMLEKTGGDFGYIYSQPSLVRMADNNWYIVTGNGFGTGAAKLIFISLNTGMVTSVAVSAADGLAGISLVDVNNDDRANIGFAGDSNGDLWKFTFSSDPSTPLVTTVTALYSAPNTNQPITTRPEVGVHPYGGYMVIFATGSAHSLTEARSTSYPTQAIYGIWDSGPGENIVTQTLSAAAGVVFTNGATSNTETVRYISSYTQPDYLCAADDHTCDIGWMVELPVSGERALASPQLRSGRIMFVTSNPNGLETDASGNLTVDMEGDSWLISLHYLYGGDDDGEVVLNLNGDGDLDAEDKIDLSSDPLVPAIKAPVGLWLADGNISQPTVASIAPGLDAIFINGLRMPIPFDTTSDNPFLSGHIDVHTDSPGGGGMAPNSIKKHSQGYNIKTNDGVGYGVDGHFHDYDSANNISYVDLFQLEPRRGKANGAVVLSGSGTCNTDLTDATQENDREIAVTDGNGNVQCLEAIEGELNRAFDTLQTDRNGVTEATQQSEVYALGTTTPLASGQAFIVVIANADLTDATLQIGCRTWDAEQYQDMITAQLESGTVPKDLVDSYHGDDTLVFTMDSILANSGGYTCPDDSTSPTLRLIFESTDILQGAIHGTRSQCVTGLHDYHDPVDYWDQEVLCYAPKHLNGETVDCSAFTTPQGAALRDPGASYIKAPSWNLHITELPSKEGSGFRWRNGALTVQLLKVNGDGSGTPYTSAYTLQDPSFLPNKKGRFGGTYARAFTGTSSMKYAGGSQKHTYPDPLAEGAGESGLLYEASMYWHLGDLSDGIQRGSPASVPCYGDPSWSSVWTQETRGLTYGQYKALFQTIDPAILGQYDAATIALEAALASGVESAIEQALAELALVLALDTQLVEYDRYRDYAPGNVPEQNLRDIDRNRIPDPDDDSSDPPPVDGDKVEDLTGGAGGGGRLENIGLGPNFVIGRRTWIDIRQ